MKKGAFLFGFLLASQSAFSVESPHNDIQVSLSENADGSRFVQGEFSIDASTRVVWDVLTDYDRMADFISDIKSSRRMNAGEEHQQVEQIMSGKVGLFHKRIYLLLNVDQRSDEKILFKDISKKSFKHYAGSWEIVPSSSQIRVRYELTAKPNFFSPDFLTVKAFRNTVRSLLVEVRNEIEGRKARYN